MYSTKLRNFAKQFNNPVVNKVNKKKNNSNPTLFIMKNLNLILAILGGAALGAAAGLLLAPKKGSDLRDSIVDFLESKGIKLKKSEIEELVEEIETEVK